MSGRDGVKNTYWSRKDRRVKLEKLIRSGHSMAAIYKRIVGSNGKPSAHGIKGVARQLGYGITGSGFNILGENHIKFAKDGIPIPILIDADAITRVPPVVPAKVEAIDEMVLEEPMTPVAKLLYTHSAAIIPEVHKLLNGATEDIMFGNEMQTVSTKLVVTGESRSEFTLYIGGAIRGEAVVTVDLSNGDSSLKYRKIRGNDWSSK